MKAFLLTILMCMACFTASADPRKDRCLRLSQGVARLENRIKELVDRPTQDGLDVQIDRMLIQALRRVQVELESEIKTSCWI